MRLDREYINCKICDQRVSLANLQKHLLDAHGIEFQSRRMKSINHKEIHTETEKVRLDTNQMHLDASKQEDVKQENVKDMSEETNVKQKTRKGKKKRAKDC